MKLHLLVSKFAFKPNLYRYPKAEAEVNAARMAEENAAGVAREVECSYDP
jgi:hypothetical protein